MLERNEESAAVTITPEEAQPEAVDRTEAMAEVAEAGLFS